MNYKKFLLGVTSTLLLTFVGIGIMILILTPFELIEGYQNIWESRFISKFITIGSLLNIPLYYYFIKKKNFNANYGQLFTLIALILFIVFTKFM